MATVNVADASHAPTQLKRPLGMTARTIVVPFPTAVARTWDLPWTYSCSTVATWLSDDQAIAAGFTVPSEFRLTAVKRTVSPIAVRVAVVGLTSRLARQNESGGSPARSVSNLELLVLTHHLQEPLVRLMGRVEAVARREHLHQTSDLKRWVATHYTGGAMNAKALPPRAPTDSSETENDRFKRSFGSWFWGSMIAATVFHFMLFQFWPTLTVKDVSFTTEELKIIELPPEIEIPSSPEAISRPATPVMPTAEIDDDITIARTTFADNPIDDLPPPPTIEAPDISAAPVFTPMTVRPEIINLAEIQQALMTQYPAMLRNAGIGGTVELWFFISKGGRVLDRRVFGSSGYVQLDEAALKVADVFRFTPALNREKIVQVWIRLPIAFQVRQYAP